MRRVGYAGLHVHAIQEIAEYVHLPVLSVIDAVSVKGTYRVELLDRLPRDRSRIGLKIDGNARSRRVNPFRFIPAGYGCVVTDAFAKCVP